MTLLEQMQEIETAKNNIKHSLELKGKNPNDDIRTYSAIINSMDGDVPSSTNIKIIIQEDEPDETIPYEGIWIKSADFTYDNVYMINSRDDVQASSVNIVRDTRRNKYSTVLIDSNVVNGYKENFYEILITDENNNILWNIPIYYGNDIMWVDITPQDIHWAGIHAEFGDTITVTRISGSNDIDDIKCYNQRIRCNLNDSGDVVAYFGDANYDNDGNANLQVMVEQPIVYVKVSNIVTSSDNSYLLSADYYIADGPLDESFEIHRAFLEEDTVYEKIYLNAYECTIVNNKLTSYNSYQYPTYGKTGVQNRTAAQARGSIWKQWTYLAHNLETLLMIVEYASFDLYSALAAGYYSNNQHNVGQVTTAMFDENGTGYTNGSKTANLSFTYRYRENPYGCCIYLEGIQTDNSNKNIYISNSHFVDDRTPTQYKLMVSCPMGYGGGPTQQKWFSYIRQIPYLFFGYSTGNNTNAQYYGYSIHTNANGAQAYSNYNNRTGMMHMYFGSPTSVIMSYGVAGLMCYPTRVIRDDS